MTILLVCRCGNPAHNTLALMVDCWTESERKAERSILVRWYEDVYRPAIDELRSLPGIREVREGLRHP